jgi:uncharacterized membrane protein YgcG
VPSGELSPAQRFALESAIREAELSSRVEFSVFLGRFAGPDTRAFATQLHNTLVAPSRSVVIAVDESRRLVEIVTGGWVRERISDAEAAHVAETIASHCAAGDVVAGLKAGLAELATFA